MSDLPFDVRTARSSELDGVDERIAAEIEPIFKNLMRQLEALAGEPMNIVVLASRAGPENIPAAIHLHSHTCCELHRAMMCMSLRNDIETIIEESEHPLQ